MGVTRLANEHPSSDALVSDLRKSQKRCSAAFDATSLSTASSPTATVSSTIASMVPRSRSMRKTQSEGALPRILKPITRSVSSMTMISPQAASTSALLAAPAPVTQQDRRSSLPTTSTSPVGGLVSSSSASTPLANTRGFVRPTWVSPIIEAEKAQFQVRCEQREKLLERMKKKREVARLGALARKDGGTQGYWLRKQVQEQHVVHIQQISDDASRKPIKFLPDLPEAAEVSRQTWAFDSAVLSPRTSAETRREVVELSDGAAIANQIVAAWSKPGHEKVFGRQMKQAIRDGKGMAPQARHFRQISEQSVADLQISASAYGQRRMSNESTSSMTSVVSALSSKP